MSLAFGNASREWQPLYFDRIAVDRSLVGTDRALFGTDLFVGDLVFVRVLGLVGPRGS